jgi:hypothetical protein
MLCWWLPWCAPLQSFWLSSYLSQLQSSAEGGEGTLSLQPALSRFGRTREKPTEFAEAMVRLLCLCIAACGGSLLFHGLVLKMQGGSQLLQSFFQAEIKAGKSRRHADIELRGKGREVRLGLTGTSTHSKANAQQLRSQTEQALGRTIGLWWKINKSIVAANWCCALSQIPFCCS